MKLDLLVFQPTTNQQQPKLAEAKTNRKGKPTGRRRV